VKTTVNFPADFLDDLRERVAVSAFVGRKVELKKKGSEFIGFSPFNKETTGSFTVNDTKRLGHDFSASKGGDVFAFESAISGCDFPEAVKRVAEFAGVDLPKETRLGSNGHDLSRRQIDNDQRPVPEDQEGDPGHDGNLDQEGGRSSKRGIAKTYDYTDAAGALTYQTCRIEWTESGKKKKTFISADHRPMMMGIGFGDCPAETSSKAAMATGIKRRKSASKSG
jgi:hypothetical protein